MDLLPSRKPFDKGSLTNDLALAIKEYCQVHDRSITPHWADHAAPYITELVLQYQSRRETLTSVLPLVSHDLQNLFGLIKGLSSLLRRDASSQEALEKDILALENAARQGEDISTRLSLFTRDIEPDKQPLDLNAVIRDIEILLHDERKWLFLNLEEVPLIYADRGQIEQIIINLVLNAHQAILDKGRINVRTRANGDFVSLSVEDSGTGIPEEVYPHIFEPFFTTTEGSGLGLTAVKSIADQNLAKIEVAANTSGGTTVTVHWPLHN